MLMLISAVLPGRKKDEERRRRLKVDEKKDAGKPRESAVGIWRLPFRPPIYATEMGLTI